MAKKELTNRQLSEILGYALERAEKNINRSVDVLESERKRIETFRVDTESAEKIFKEADTNFKQSLSVYTSELKKLQNAKPKWLQIKDWLLVGVLSLLVVIFAGLAISSYYKLNKLEVENEKLNNIVENVSRYFEENPKEKKTFEGWNN